MKSLTEQEILDRLSNIEILLKVKNDKPLNSAETSFYLSISLSHLYKLTRGKKIPFHKPTGKYLYFYKNELDEWIAGRLNTRMKKRTGEKIPPVKKLF